MTPANPISRRSFLQTTAATALLGPSLVRARSTERKKIAMLVTEVRLHSHGQHFVDRFAKGYIWDGQWHRPDVDFVSMYVDQFPKDDLAKATAKQHKIGLYPTVAEALTQGTSKLAVDGVVIIAEHGTYPRNEKKQTLYPRYKFFKQSVGVFESSGKSVPIFNDKHLSTDWKQCTEMVADSKRLGFPFLAGSSLPVTWRMPSIDVSLDTPLTESVCAGYGGVDSYDFHGLETAQCMSERRAGGEVGIVRVQALRNDKVWAEVAKRESTQKLLSVALCRSHNLPVKNGYPTAAISFDWARSVFPTVTAYFIEHADGFRTTMFLLPIHDFNYAGLNGKTGEIISCQMYLPMPTFSASTADFFNPLVHHIERMVIENRVPFPIERTLLTSGMTLAAVESLYRNGAVVETPEMAVRYSAPKESSYWRS